MENAILRNKAAVMDALAAADITSVTVAFDGSGDEGQIESVVAYAGEVTVPLPDTFVKTVDADQEEYTGFALMFPLLTTLCSEVCPH